MVHFLKKVLGDLFMPHRFKWPSSYTADLLVFFISYFSGFWPLFWQRGGYTVTCQTRQYQIFRDSSLQWEIIFGKNSSNLHYYRRPKKQVFSTYVHQNHRSILWYFSCMMFKNRCFWHIFYKITLDIYLYLVKFGNLHTIYTIMMLNHQRFSTCVHKNHIKWPIFCKC